MWHDLDPDDPCHAVAWQGDLPQKMPVLSPGVDADLGVPADEAAAAFAAQTWRRAVKTHTPTDGFPVWDGVTVIAVYRHPLDLLFSMRKHTANQTSIDPDNPSGWPLARSIWAFIHDPTAHDALANDNLANIAMHYRETALSSRLPDLKLFHYANMIRDGQRVIEMQPTVQIGGRLHRNLGQRARLDHARVATTVQG